MENIVDRFIAAKFGKDSVCNVDFYEDHNPEGTRGQSDLKTVLEEFAEVITAVELAELKNPRTKKFVLVNVSEGTIIGSYTNSILNEEEV